MDETLFSGKYLYLHPETLSQHESRTNPNMLTAIGKKPAGGRADVAIITNDELRKLRGETEKGATREAGILTN